MNVMRRLTVAVRAIGLDVWTSAHLQDRELVSLELMNEPGLVRVGAMFPVGVWPARIYVDGQRAAELLEEFERETGCDGPAQLDRALEVWKMLVAAAGANVHIGDDCCCHGCKVSRQIWTRLGFTMAVAS